MAQRVLLVSSIFFDDPFICVSFVFHLSFIYLLFVFYLSFIYLSFVLGIILQLSFCSLGVQDG